MRWARTTALSAMLLAAAAAVAAAPAGAVPGDLDTDIGTDGKTTTDFASGDDQARGLVLQPDGKVVAVGSFPGPRSSDFAIARYTAEGRLDPGFGYGGKVTTDFGKLDEALAVVLQPDGRLLVAGYAHVGETTDFALARYTPSGVLDPSFGDGGMVTTDIGGRDNEASGVALQPDGKIVAAGCWRCQGPASDFAVIRYQPDGSVDTTFGIGGHVITDFAQQTDSAEDVLVQPDGKIVAGGYASVFEKWGIGAGSRTADFALARYDADGGPDASFGNGGKVTVDFDQFNDAGSAIALQPDGKIVTAGLAYMNSTGGFDFGLARVNPDGTPDATFGREGRVSTDFGDDAEHAPGDGGYGRGEAATGVVIQPDGWIVAGGVNREGRSDDFALARYTPNGALDPSFGNGGKVTTDFAGRSDGAAGVGVRSDGTIVAAGVADMGTQDFALAFYRSGVISVPSL